MCPECMEDFMKWLYAKRTGGINSMTNGERKEAIKWVESRAKVATMPGAQKMFRFALEALRKWIGANRKGRITMTQNELDKILENHKKWLNGEDGGSRANLRGANLRGANLQVADLRGADLRDVNLWDAALQGAKLWGADLQGANLQGANLRAADLRGADLRAAELRDVNLWGADLRGANLWGADLRGAALQVANFMDANFSDVNLGGADLRGANLQTADLRGADVDYSCWPLGCGSLDVIVDRRIFCQLAYHLCRVIVDDDECKEAQLMLGKLANEFHRADECGRVPENEDKR